MKKDYFFCMFLALNFFLAERTYGQVMSGAGDSLWFAINGWTPGSSTPLALNSSGSITTNLRFIGCPNDVFGDVDNPSSIFLSMSFSIYLTPVGSSFSATGSYKIGDHLCSFGNVFDGSNSQPWQCAIDYNGFTAPNCGGPAHFNTTNYICQSIPNGAYQVDILLTDYSQSNLNCPSDYVAWAANANNSATSSSIVAPNANGPLSPASSYLFSKIALVNYTASTTPITLSLASPIRVCSNNKASATVWASATTGCPLTYLWSDAAHQTTTTATNLSPGTYTVTVTAPSGTTASASTTITTGAVSTSINSSTPTGCTGTVLTLTANTSNGNAPYSYNWSAGSASGNTDVITPSSASTVTYAVTVTDALGCTTTSSKSVTSYNSPSVTITPALSPYPTPQYYVVPCTNGVGSKAVTGAGSGGTSPYSYSWSNGATAANTTLNTYISGAMYTYTLTVTDAHSCTASLSRGVQCATGGGKMDMIDDYSTNLNLFPNPTLGILTIHIPGIIEGSADISIQDIEGRKILSNTAFIVPGNDPTLDLSKLAKGIYIISVTAEGQNYSGKVVLE